MRGTGRLASELEGDPALGQRPSDLEPLVVSAVVRDSVQTHGRGSIDIDRHGDFEVA